MGAEDGNGMGWNFRQILDKDRAFGLQAFDDVFVMDDLVAHIDRWPVFLERPLDNLDRTHDACAKAARLRKKHFDGATFNQAAPRSSSASVRQPEICASPAPSSVASIHARSAWWLRTLWQKHPRKQRQIPPKLLACGRL